MVFIGDPANTSSHGGRSAGAQPYGSLVARLVSLTEKGNENHSQAKAKGRAPVVGAASGSILWGWGELITPQLGLVLVLCQPLRAGLGLDR